MKKIFLYIVGFVVICFIIPFVFTNKFETKTVETSENAETQKEEKGENYPVITIMQNKRYIIGASSVAIINFELALGSILVGIIIEMFNCIYKLLKNTIIKIKESKKGKKNEK